MKKLFAILISLLFIASVFGVTQTMAVPNGDHYANATPENVKVGDLITVTTNFYDSDPEIIADGNLPKGDAVLVSRPERDDFSRLFPVEDHTYTWTYRATVAGTIKFEFSPPSLEPVDPPVVSNPVTITGKSYPMNSFMKILGFDEGML